jgi:hypothetical protein
MLRIVRLIKAKKTKKNRIVDDEKIIGNEKYFHFYFRFSYYQPESVAM